ncbi:steroid receptor RNA activator 1, partial [Varanus komodoensis]
GPPPLPAHTASWPSRRPGASPGADVAEPLGPDAEEACEAEDVLSTLGATLEACRGRAQKQVCDEISKRLAMLQQMWVQGNLSAPVRRGMGILTQELEAQRWESADEIHRSLMVDHVAEVSQWMVGIKRLIAEAKDLHAGDLPAEDPGQQ